MGWLPVDRIVVALFNFTAQGEHQLSLEVGDTMCVLEEHSGWYRGHPFHNPTKMGIFPSCVVYIKEHSTIKVGNASHMIPAEDEVALETTYLVREWWRKLKAFYLSGQRTNYKMLLGQMEDILSSRRNLLKSNATLDVLQTLRTKLTAKLDHINNFLTLPVSPRDDNGKLLNCYDTGLHRLDRVHRDRKKELEHHVAQTGALNRKKEDTSSSTGIHHLFAHINKVDHDPPEDCEVFFFLYDSDKPGQVSERFMLHVSPAAGHSNKEKEPDHLDKKTVLFTDLGSKDLGTSGMHLVCQVVRRGKMLLDDKKNIAQNPYRRPYACGALEVSSLLQATDKLKPEEEWFENASLSMPLYVCAANHESDFATFHNNIIRKTSGRAGQKPGCAIALTVKAFHGDLNEVKKNFPGVFEKPMEIVHKLGFPDVILPGDVRNDIYVTLEHGTFEKGTKRSERNVEVAIEVIDGSRNVVPRAIVLAAGDRRSNEYESFVFYHNNTPKWTETFKLAIPFEKLPDAHLRIAFRHVAKAEAKDKSEKTFAFTFMKIMRDDGSIVSDGPHELFVYKADHKRWFDPKTYLSLASCKEDLSSNRTSQTYSPGQSLNAGGNLPGVTRSSKESITITTLTCSTKLTQKIELLMLLKWRQRKRDLGVVLTNMLHIGGEEVVKFLQDTLDCLFDILSTNQEVYGEKIFEVLVSIFGLMQDDKYQHFKTVLDIYISKHFSAILAHRFLVWCFEKHVREYGGIPDLHSKKLCPVLKSMQYLFRFMIQSHTLYVKANKKQDPQFSEELRQVFSTLSSLMNYQENKVKDVYLVQSIVLGNLPPVLVDVVTVLSEDSVAVLISQFLDSIRNTHATLPRDKLKFMLQVMDGPLNLFQSHGPRRQLLPTYTSHLISYMGHTMPKTDFKPEVQSNGDCLMCLGRVLEVLSEPEVDVSDEDVEVVVGLLLSLLRLSKQIARNNPLYAHNMVNLIGLLYLMQDKHYASLFASQKSTFGSALKDFLMDFMLAITNIIKYAIFPPTWVAMFLMQSKVLSRALINIAKALLDSFLGTHNFSPLIWDEFFSICTSFVTQQFLQLEEFSDYRKNLYLQQFGDFRVIVGKQVILLWHKLSSHKGQFIPDLINPFLKLSLLRQRDLRRISIPLLFDVIKCEHRVNGNFKRVETEVFDKIDELLFSGQGDEEYKEMFHEILVSQCQGNELLRSSGIAFIENVTRLIALLLDYRSVPSDDYNRGRRMGCMLNLLHFYKDIEKEELYVKYIYKLTELHEKEQSYTEAGFTLLLHARGLDWGTEQLVASMGKFPAQTSRERKEQLYMSAIQLFDKGKSWECGIPLCKELARLYETEIFDYTKLAAILQKEAEFFRKIIDIQQLRVAPEYFMVGYYAKGFPLFLRNKIFIHRGQPYEKLGGFIKRLTDEFTSAEILKTTTPPESDIQNSSGMYLQVRTVLPVAKQHDKFQGKNVPDKVAAYYQTNEVQEFRYDRPFHKGKKNKECEFASLWMDRTTFTTVDSFPGVISWFEVSDVKEVELDPLGIALETMESKNQEIQLQTAIYSADKSLSINPLSMLLNGVIDAAVMGGIGNYEKIFFNPAYIGEHPDDADRVKELRGLIEEQAAILEKALALHGQLIDQQLQGFHAKLVSCFEDFQGIVFPERRKVKTPRKVARSATIARPLPPTPLASTPSTPIGSSGHATLPNKMMMRRATGMPGPSRRVPTYEDTDIDNPHRNKQQHIPNPPFHEGSRKNREGSPKVPSPYLSKTRLGLSPSTGDMPDMMKRYSGSQHSSSSSLNQLSDYDADAYEPIADYLRESSSGGESSAPSSVPKPASVAVVASSFPKPAASLNEPPVLGGQQQQPPPSLTGFNAPSYPAPIPPKKSREVEKRVSGHFDGVMEEDGDEDDGYTQVKLEGGQVEIQGFNDDVERAVLPLLSSSSTRSSVALDSDHSSPMRSDRNPDGGGGGRMPTYSPQNRAKWAPTNSSGGTKFIPPEPTSPPPSPPTGIRHTSPVPVALKPPSSLMTRQNIGSDAGSSSSISPMENPKLPPKKRHAHSSISASVNDEDDIYAFDTLQPDTTPKQSAPPPLTADPAHIDEDIYAFDTLEQLPPPRGMATGTATFQPSYDDENIYEFDNLEEEESIPPPATLHAESASKYGANMTSSGPPKIPPPYSRSPVGSEAPPPPIPKKMSVSRPSMSTSSVSMSSSVPAQQFQYHDDEDVYSFDALDPVISSTPPTNTTPTAMNIGPPNRSVSAGSGKQTPVFADDNDIYTFDTLEPSVQNLGHSPEPGPASDHSTSSPPDAVYFDHLVTNQKPTLPSKNPPPGPRYGAEKPPVVPPKTSPPIVKKTTPSPASTSPESAPPLPIKRRGTMKSSSVDTPEVSDNKPRPTPRARGATVDKQPPTVAPFRPPKPPTPNLPPKPAQPNIPPKSRPPPKANGDSKPPPPIPSKNVPRWPPKR